MAPARPWATTTGTGSFCSGVESPVAAPLWEKYADQFPVRDNLIYLNHAAVAPIPRRTADAIRHLADDSLNWGSLHYSEWLDVTEGLPG